MGSVGRENKTPYGTESTSEASESRGVQDMIKDKKFENIGIWVEFNMYFKNFKRISFN